MLAVQVAKILRLDILWVVVVDVIAPMAPTLVFANTVALELLIVFFLLEDDLPSSQ